MFESRFFLSQAFLCLLSSCLVDRTCGFEHSPTRCHQRSSILFVSQPPRTISQALDYSDYENDRLDKLSSSTNYLSRSRFLSTAISVLTTLPMVSRLPAAFAEEGPVLPQQQEQPKVLTMFQLPSGVKYLDLEPGTGPTPEYGQFCSIAYKAYIKLPANKKDPNPKPQQFDSSDAFLLKHGNGRLIPGLDEGLHTLKVGGSRRIIIPPKLGYVTSGLGPIPEYFWNRIILDYMLDQMVALRGGTVIFEVTLLSAIDDEADQGYYKDGSLTPEQFQQLRDNIQERAAAAARAEI